LRQQTWTEAYEAAKREHRGWPPAQMLYLWELGEGMSRLLPQPAKVGRSLRQEECDESSGLQAWICRRHSVPHLKHIKGSSLEYHNLALDSSLVTGLGEVKVNKRA